MNDFFQEVRAELDADRKRAAWKRLAPIVYGTAALIVLATAANELYAFWRTEQIEDSARSFETGHHAMRDGDFDAARAAFEETLEKGGQFADLAVHFIAGMEIHAAAPDQEPGQPPPVPNPARAAEARKAAADSLWREAGIDTPLARMAALKAGYLSADTMSFEDLTQRLSPLTEAGGAFALLAHELLGAKALVNKKTDAARIQYEAILADEDTVWPELLKRAQQALLIIDTTPTPSQDATPTERSKPEDASEDVTSPESSDSPALTMPEADAP